MSSLGDLSAFPVEIVAVICLSMDVTSVFRFRQVNRLARNIASSLLPYRDIVTHAIEAFRATLRTRIGMHFTLTDLHGELCKTKCFTCGNFGGFLFLPYLKRCCFDCIQNHYQTGVASIVDLANHSGISQAELCRLLPVVHAVAGTFSLQQVRRTRGQKFVNRDFVDRMKSRRIKPRPRYGPSFYGHSDPIVHDAWAKTMVSTAFPSLDPVTGEVECGIHCKGCFRRASDQGYNIGHEYSPGRISWSISGDAKGLNCTG